MSSTAICSYIEPRIYTAAGALVDVALPEAHSFAFSDPLADEGSIGFTVPLSADALQADPDLLENGIVKLATVLEPGAEPEEFIAGELVPSSATIVPGRNGVRELRCTALSQRHLLEYAPLFPEVRATWDKNAEDTRLFFWGSIDTAAWYDAGDWSTPLSYGPVGSGAWPYPNAQKITADLTPAAGDVNLFRSEFTFATDNRCRIDWLCDDIGSLYIDSELVDTCTTPGARTRTVYLNLTAGGHTIAAIVTNSGGPQLKLAVCVATANADGTAGQVRRITDTGHWKTHKVIGGVVPGWTVGGILTKLLAEAQGAQNVYGVDLLTPDFTHTLDSNGDAWPTLPEQGWLTGQTSLLRIVRELEEQWCDVRVLPDGTFQAFQEQGTDVSATVRLRRAHNLKSLTDIGTAVRATKALVRSLAGWTIATDSAGVAAWGNRYMGFTAGEVVSNAQAARLALRALDETASPRYPQTALIAAKAGAVPFKDFIPGDTVKGLNRIFTPTSKRVLSIAGSTPAKRRGPITFSVELEDP